MDSDDLVVPGRFKAQAQFLDIHLGAAVVGTFLQYICEHGNNIGLQDYPLRQKRNVLGLISPMLAHPSVMMRHENLISVGGYNHDYPHVEDLELWLRLSRKHDLHNIPTRFLRYRLHANQTSRIKSDDQLKYGLLAFLNDARHLSRLNPIDTKTFEATGVREFFSRKKELLAGLTGPKRAVFSMVLQEKFLEKYHLQYLLSVPRKTLIYRLLVGKISEPARSDILKNLPGLSLIFIKIILRRMRATLTESGRQASKLRAALSQTCPLCEKKRQL
jgi:hypothetical protein